MSEMVTDVPSPRSVIHSRTADPVVLARSNVVVPPPMFCFDDWGFPHPSRVGLAESATSTWADQPLLGEVTVSCFSLWAPSSLRTTPTPGFRPPKVRLPYCSVDHVVDASPSTRLPRSPSCS